MTSAPLVANDVDTSYDVYDAIVCGVSGRPGCLPGRKAPRRPAKARANAVPARSKRRAPAARQRRSLRGRQHQRPARSARQQNRRKAEATKPGGKRLTQGTEAHESAEGVQEAQEQIQAPRLRSPGAQEVRRQEEEVEEGRTATPRRTGDEPAGRQESSVSCSRRARASARCSRSPAAPATASAASSWWLIDQSYRADQAVKPGSEARSSTQRGQRRLRDDRVDARTAITISDKLPEGVEVVPKARTAIAGRSRPAVAEK